MAATSTIIARTQADEYSAAVLRSTSPECATLDGAFLLAADLLVGLLYPLAGLPSGLVTALLGVPFFVSLLRRRSC